MEKVKKDDLGILFVRDVDRRLMTEFRTVCLLQGVSKREAVEDALRSYINAKAPWSQKEGK